MAQVQGSSLKCLCGCSFIPIQVHSCTVFVLVVLPPPASACAVECKFLKLEAMFLNLGCTCSPEACGLAVGQLPVIRASEHTPLCCIISRPFNPQWKSKAGTQEIGVE